MSGRLVSMRGARADSQSSGSGCACGVPSVPRFTSFSTTMEKVRVLVGSPAPSRQVISPIRVSEESSVSPPTPRASLRATVLKLGAHS
ncbi:MAG: hypothetical protein NTW21_15185, partial [Verrucomicrobia bacterium]|nr:hypothetical protein [Verrucomicrobiota bacterium]